MRTEIVYLVDINTLTNTRGTFAQPTPYNHPPMQYRHDGGAWRQAAGDYTVTVPQQEQVWISLAPHTPSEDCIIAPVRFVTNTWNNKNITLEDVAASNSDRLMDPVEFEHTVDTLHDYKYTGSPTGWEQDSAPFTSWFHGVMDRQDVSMESPKKRSPFMQFNVRGTTGTLNYGIEFTAAVGGESKGYFFFDPYLEVR